MAEASRGRPLSFTGDKSSLVTRTVPAVDKPHRRSYDAAASARIRDGERRTEERLG
jgi:hypothetical protein